MKRFFEKAIDASSPKVNAPNEHKVHGVFCRAKDLIHKNKKFIEELQHEHGKVKGGCIAVLTLPAVMNVGVMRNAVEYAEEVVETVARSIV